MCWLPTLHIQIFSSKKSLMTYYYILLFWVYELLRLINKRIYYISRLHSLATTCYILHILWGEVLRVIFILLVFQFATESTSFTRKNNFWWLFRNWKCWKLKLIWLPIKMNPFFGKENEAIIVHDILLFPSKERNRIWISEEKLTKTKKNYLTEKISIKKHKRE